MYIAINILVPDLFWYTGPPPKIPITQSQWTYQYIQEQKQTQAKGPHDSNINTPHRK